MLVFKNFWSFNVGKAHVVHIDSYSSVSTQMFDGAVADTFQTWLDNDLARVNRKQTPWIIAVFHAPWYNSNSAHYKENEPQRLKYEQILYKFGVDVALNGHVHSYERSYPVYNNQRDECGIAHSSRRRRNLRRTIRLELDDSATVLVGISRRFFRRGFFNRAQRYAHELKWERNACVHPDGTTDLNHNWSIVRW